MLRSELFGLGLTPWRYFRSDRKLFIATYFLHCITLFVFCCRSPLIQLNLMSMWWETLDEISYWGNRPTAIIIIIIMTCFCYPVAHGFWPFEPTCLALSRTPELLVSEKPVYFGNVIRPAAALMVWRRLHIRTSCASHLAESPRHPANSRTSLIPLPGAEYYFRCGNRSPNSLLYCRLKSYWVSVYDPVLLHRWIRLGDGKTERFKYLSTTN